MTPNELSDYVKKHGAKMIDAKFVDFLGQWKHLTYPIERLSEGIEEGFGFDGSSVAGWRAINSSDMLMKPDPTTAVIDPFLKTPTLSTGTPVLVEDATMGASASEGVARAPCTSGSRLMAMSAVRRCPLPGRRITYRR